MISEITKNQRVGGVLSLREPRGISSRSKETDNREEMKINSLLTPLSVENGG